MSDRGKRIVGLKLVRLDVCDGLCECGSADCQRRVTQRDDLHHVSYARFGNERPEDVRLVTRECHDRIHGKRGIVQLSLLDPPQIHVPLEVQEPSYRFIEARIKPSAGYAFNEPKTVEIETDIRNALGSVVTVSSIHATDEHVNVNAFRTECIPHCPLGRPGVLVKNGRPFAVSDGRHLFLYGCGSWPEEFRW